MAEPWNTQDISRKLLVKSLAKLLIDLVQVAEAPEIEDLRLSVA